jgi:tetratricopeptide (TPR) repeat protein
MPKQTIYTLGGTVQAGAGVYIKRKADDELLELCRQGEFAFILSSRQVGKSSLMVRTAQQLEKENICSVTIDLSAIGVNVSQDEWYLGILNEIQSTLNLGTDIFSWWEQYAQLGPAQRLANFFRDVLLKEIKEQIVLFFDEIDSTLSIPFSDDFYVALRAVYNARSTTPDFKRLSFVLVGVAAPSDLISDNRRTPFNIGRRVEIKDFTLAEALPLAQGLGQQAEKVLAWVLQYSGGHPYLTQRLCADLANSKEAIDEQTVANTVERLFTGEQGKQDNNLQFVRDMLSKRSPDVARVLSIYKDVRSGKNVADDERSITKSHLKLSGLVRSDQGFLCVRNEIYNSVFNLRWIQENTPKNWQRTAVISLSVVLSLLVLGTLALFIFDFWVGTQVNRSIADFISNTSPTDRLTDLAKIYSQKGILSNTDSSLQAAQLFYGLSAKDQLSLLTNYAIAQEPRLQKDLVVVIGHLYVTVADVNPVEDNTELLKTMRDSLKNVQNDQIAVNLQSEINSWLNGREKARNRDYVNALFDYTDAINTNPNNQATLYERAKVYIALTRHTEALKDLDTALAKAQESAPSPRNTRAPTESPLPPSETPQTDSIRPFASSRPTAIASGETATNTAPPTAAPMPTSQSAGTPQVDSYESHFTTLIDVLNAVSALIEAEPGLQAAIQGSGKAEYANLKLYELDRNYPTLSTSLSPDSFQADYVNTVHPCPATWWVRINLTNKFNVDFKSMSLSVKDTISEEIAAPPDSPDIFLDRDPEICNPDIEVGDDHGVDNLEFGKSVMVSSGVFRKDPTNHTLEATLRLCTEEALEGQCSEKTINFAPGVSPQQTANIFATSTPPNMTKVPIPAEPYRLYATEDDLALRAEPSFSGFLWKRLVIGTELICLEPKATAQAKLGVNGQWIHVQDPAGDQGYVAAGFVSDSKELTAVTPTPTIVIPGQSKSVPLIETLNVDTHPTVPAGLKEAFLIGPDSLESSPTTNVVKFNGLTYWAYSYIDNRFSLAIVAYDSSNNIIRQWEKSGARYLWKITVDSNNQTVVFHGQASNTIVMQWSDLVP